MVFMINKAGCSILLPLIGAVLLGGCGGEVGWSGIDSGDGSEPADPPGLAQVNSGITAADPIGNSIWVKCKNGPCPIYYTHDLDSSVETFKLLAEGDDAAKDGERRGVFVSSGEILVTSYIMGDKSRAMDKHDYPLSMRRGRVQVIYKNGEAGKTYSWVDDGAMDRESTGEEGSIETIYCQQKYCPVYESSNDLAIQRIMQSCNGVPCTAGQTGTDQYVACGEARAVFVRDTASRKYVTSYPMWDRGGSVQVATMSDWGPLPPTCTKNDKGEVASVKISIPDATNANRDLGENEPWVDVDQVTQTLTAYVGRIPQFMTHVRTGAASSYTYNGNHFVSSKFRSGDMGCKEGYNYCYRKVQFIQYFHWSAEALHAATSNNVADWNGYVGQPGNTWGTPGTAGCVNIPGGFDENGYAARVYHHSDSIDPTDCAPYLDTTCKGMLVRVHGDI